MLMLESLGAGAGQWLPPGPRPSHCVFLLVTGPVLQPLERLKDQGRAGPRLLALAGSEQEEAKNRGERRTSVMKQEPASTGP